MKPQLWWTEFLKNSRQTDCWHELSIVVTNKQNSGRSALVIFSRQKPSPPFVTLKNDFVTYIPGGRINSPTISADLLMRAEPMRLMCSFSYWGL